jgi:hypothetical protein
MSNSKATATADVARTAAPDIVTVTLLPDQAKYAAQTLFSFLSGELERKSLVCSREEFDDLRATFDLYQGFLAEIGWGETAGDVDLTMPRDLLADLTARMTEGIGDLDYQRERLREAEAGMAIIEQLAIEQNA